MAEVSGVTRILSAIEQGDSHAAEHLLRTRSRAERDSLSDTASPESGVSVLRALEQSLKAVRALGVGYVE
jgi:hypothetical protein